MLSFTRQRDFNPQVDEFHRVFGRLMAVGALMLTLKCLPHQRRTRVLQRNGEFEGLTGITQVGKSLPKAALPSIIAYSKLSGQARLKRTVLFIDLLFTHRVDGQQDRLHGVLGDIDTQETE